MFKNFFLIILPFFFLSSCIVNMSNHGYEQDAENFMDLKANKSHKSDVLNEAGSPSVVSTFNQNIWYYISTKTRRVSILNPKVVESRVIQLNFNNSDVLSDVVIYSIDTHRALAFSKSQSSIKGDDTGLLKDFFYNFGRFNKLGK